MVQCPSCGGEFDAETIRSTTVAFCTKCDGLWLGAGDLDRLTGLEIESQLDDWMAEPTECRYCQTPLGFGAECVRCGRAPTIQCPRGHGVMNAALVEVADREFEIDRCASCRGIWIDGHEEEHLHAVPEPERPTLARPVSSPHGSNGNARAIELVERMAHNPLLSRGHSFQGIHFPIGEKSEKSTVLVFAVLLLAAFAAFYFFVAPVLSF